MRPSKADDDLKRLSGHLAYEVEMVCWQAHYMAEALIDKWAETSRNRPSLRGTASPHAVGAKRRR